MSFVVDNRREDNHTREKHGSVRNFFSIFFSRVYLKSACSQTFQLITLKSFKQLDLFIYLFILYFMLTFTIKA